MTKTILSKIRLRTRDLARYGLTKVIDKAKHRPAEERVNFGDFRRLSPISRYFGYDRGLPIDRFYIEHFLKRHANDIQGRVLEIGDDSYTVQFGGSRVISRDVLHLHEGNPSATFVGNLADADHIASEAFDCFIVTQTLHLIYDCRSAVKTIHRILRPGGVVLATVPGVSQISVDEWADYWCWSFTTFSAERLFTEFFPTDHVQVEAFGNVLTAVAFLQGLSSEEMTPYELNYRDRCYPILISIRAMKPNYTASEARP